MEQKKKILSQINSLDLNTEQYIEIYKIIKQDNIKIMKNNNGVFINLDSLSQNVLNNLEKFIQYILTNDLSKNI
jgi:hypothetical protein